jgi:RNA polymerase sigma-70 factor (ECF subfamily)
VTAARTAINFQRRDKRYILCDDARPIESPDADPELDYLKRRYGAELRSAFQSTLGALPRRDATILRLFFLNGITIDAIGRMYKVSGRTVQRWITSVREHILKETRRLLQERLDVGAAELESLLRLAQSQLEMSISRYLKR